MRRIYLGPLISGVAMVLAFPPLSIPLLPFVGLIPFFAFFERPRMAREALIGGFAFSFPYFVGNIFWLFNLARFTQVAALGAIGTLVLHWTTFLLFPLTVNVVRHVLPRWPLWLVLPATWMVSEHTRTFGDFSFGWVLLGYSLDDWPRLIQHADLVGVYGVSLWLASINALLLCLWRAAGLRRRLTFATVCLLLFALPLAYGAVRFRTVEAAMERSETIRVALLQPNVPQDQKWDPQSVRAILSRIDRLIARAEAGEPDLVLGPEAAIPIPLADDATRLVEELSPGRRPLMIGALVGIGEGEPATIGGRPIRIYDRHYNAAVLAAPDRRVLGRHDKVVLVPITEQIPYKDVFGFLTPLMRAQFGRFDPGGEVRVLEITARDGRRIPVAGQVCYESLFPWLNREMRAKGALLFANLTNDAWFGRTSAPYQHVAFGAMRAVENRISFVRSANTGFSAAYDPLGRQIARTELFEETVLQTEVPLLDLRTTYGRLGDVALWLCYAVWLAALAAAALRARSSITSDSVG